MTDKRRLELYARWLAEEYDEFGEYRNHLTIRERDYIAMLDDCLDIARDKMGCTGCYYGC